MALSNVHWRGLKALEVMADVLPKKIGGQKLREAYRFALTPVREKMRNNLPNNRTGALYYATDITIGGTQELQQMYGLVGPRRKRNTWNQKGWHAHIIESGTKPHVITSSKGGMPIFAGAGKIGYAKKLDHPGTRAIKPFSKAIDISWNQVADDVSDKVAKIMREEIKTIQVQYGQVVTKSGSII